jgi:hypothetical protein
MTINLDLPQELEQELSTEAEKINLSLSEYIVYLLSARQLLNNPPKTGANLVNYWQKEGLINSRSDIQDSQEYARKIRHEAEHRQHL